MKKKYEKPVLVIVKLEVQNPILAGCTVTSPTAKESDCEDCWDPCVEWHP